MEPPPPVAESGTEGTLGYLPTYYPGVTDDASAAEINVAAGQQLSGMDIRLRKGRVFKVSGKIQGAPADSIRIQVSLQPRRTGQSGGVTFGFGGAGNVKPDGTFTLPSVMPGSWDLVAMSLGSGRPQTLGRSSVTVTNANVENIVIQASAPLELTGRVIQERAGEQQDTSRTGGTVNIMLQAALPIPMFVQPGRVRDDGTFSISGVPRDHFMINVLGLLGDQYVKSVRAGNVDVTTAGLDLSAAETAPPIEIRISPRGASVSGVVLDGDKPSPGSIVTALVHPINPDRRSAMQKTGTTDQHGRFTLQGLAPGEYRIYAWDSYMPANDLDAEQLKPFDKFSAVVKLKEEAREQVELKLARWRATNNPVGPRGRSTDW